MRTRVELGIGTGSLADDYTALGMNFESGSTRFARLRFTTETHPMAHSSPPTRRTATYTRSGDAPSGHRHGAGPGDRGHDVTVLAR